MPLPEMTERDAFFTPSKRYVVIKYGGHLMEGGDTAFSKQIVSLYKQDILPIIVHGGGPEITQMLTRLDIPSEFIDGLRKTTEESLEIIQMVLCGIINKRLANSLTLEGASAVGISGTDASLIVAERMSHELGFVGRPVDVNTAVLETILKGNVIPVIAPISADLVGQSYNINADAVAAFIAGALQISLFILTDVAGVRDANGEIRDSLNEFLAQKFYDERIIKDGMYPKVQACLSALKLGAKEAFILDGRVPKNLHRFLIDNDHYIGTKISLD
ncbi:acetylglutamate kinase [Acetobacteraceae bacterium]|nr:acetylglutamate kinase [Acetobacteraceae bacterium]